MIIGGCRGPGWQVFDADPRLGSQIRNWISSAISGHDCPVDAADAAVVVSELFGNAVIHGPADGRVLVGYCLWREGARLSSAMAAGLACRGWYRAASSPKAGGVCGSWTRSRPRWGSFRVADARAVWCDFGQPLHAGPGDAWPGCIWSCPCAACLTPAAWWPP